MSEELLRTARYLTERPEGSTPADLCAAISTTYYALFETVAKLTADYFIGVASPDRAETAWRHVYRSMSHSLIASRCLRTAAYQFPQSIVDFAQLFVTLQEKREKSDYEYGYKPDSTAVKADIDRAKQKIDQLLQTEEKHLRAFCVFIFVDKYRHEYKQKVFEKPSKKN